MDLEEAILIALKEIKATSYNEGGLRYQYIQNWMTNILVKCKPETNVYEFYKRLEQ